MTTSPQRRLKVLAPIGYPWTFNGPRQSRHDIRRRYFVPFNRIRSRYDGITVFSPTDSLRCDLVHAFNRIPLGQKPFVIGFESHLPRVFGLEKTWPERLMWRQLLAPRCRRIVGISHFARRTFEKGLAGSGLSSGQRRALLAKLEVRHPNMAVGEDWGEEWAGEWVREGSPGPIRVTFVGNHFARKGGCSVARMAEMSQQRGLPFHFHIVSTLQSGGAIWSDPTDETVFEPYLRLLSLPNVTHYPGLPNAQVMELLGKSHVSLLPTFSDTFGFSATESMARGTPVLATRQGALPEFIRDGISGGLLDPARSEGAEEWQPDYLSRGSAAFRALFIENVERLAAEGLARLEGICADSAAYMRMRRAALEECRAVFDHRRAANYWDGLYEAALPAPG